ncbi:MAG: tetratricopeptide repeat protein [Anaerolineales bacterium]
MTAPNRRQRRAQLQQARQQLESAQEQGDPAKILRAQLDLGIAYFHNGKYPEGLEAFSQARELSEETGEPREMAQVMGTQILAFQSIDRLPDAFNLANEMIALAEDHQDPAIKADGLRFKGEALLESGKPTEAFEELRQALAAAEQADDLRRQMAANASLGHLSLVIAAPDQAEKYFDNALQLARQTNDQEAEGGYLGNKGTVLAWRGEYQAAADAFQRVLELADETDNRQAAINASHHLAKAHSRLHQNEQALEVAQSGLERLGDQDSETAFSFLETIILSHYRLNQIEPAHQATQQAIELAKSSRDRNKEVDMLVSLGESFLGAERPEQALEAYQQALQGAEEMERDIDRAHLTGRIGVAKAESGQLQEAIDYHLRAIELARENELAELEGDQRCLLALTYLELQNREAARQQCVLAVEKYQQAELPEGVERAEQLLEQIDRTEA